MTNLIKTSFGITIVFLALSLASTSVASGENGPEDNRKKSRIDGFTECATILAAPPFADILTKNDGRDFDEINAHKSGRILLGLECSVENIVDFFAVGGWEFNGYNEMELSGPFGGHLGVEPYYSDAVAFFCLKRRSVYSLFLPKCIYRSSVIFHRGRISHIIAHVSK